MQLIIFLALISAMGLYHRREHRLFEKEVRDIAKNGGSTEGRDWREVGRDTDGVVLKRAFHVYTLADKLRYAMPLLFLAAMLVFLQAWAMAGAYLLALLLKWFALDVRIGKQLYDPEYEVRFFGLRLFGAAL